VQYVDDLKPNEKLHQVSLPGIEWVLDFTTGMMTVKDVRGRYYSLETERIHEKYRNLPLSKETLCLCFDWLVGNAVILLPKTWWDHLLEDGVS
jgi:hypothetical protein